MRLESDFEDHSAVKIWNKIEGELANPQMEWKLIAFGILLNKMAHIRF